MAPCRVVAAIRQGLVIGAEQVPEQDAEGVDGRDLGVEIALDLLRHKISVQDRKNFIQIRPLQTLIVELRLRAVVALDDNDRALAGPFQYPVNRLQGALCDELGLLPITVHVLLKRASVLDIVAAI